MKVGFVCGAFDLLHAGHILMLEAAKDHCDHLIVGLQVDPSLERPKSKTKPVQSLLERFIQLDGCKHVDTILTYETEKDLEIILNNTNIDLRFLGDDYAKGDKQITAKEVVPIIYLRRNHPYSTTELKGRIRNGKS